MGKHLAAPGFTNQIIVIHDTTVCVKFPTGFQHDYEMFVTQANQFHKVAFLRVSSMQIPAQMVLLFYCRQGKIMKKFKPIEGR